MKAKDFKQLSQDQLRDLFHSDKCFECKKDLIFELTGHHKTKYGDMCDDCYYDAIDRMYDYYENKKIKIRSGLFYDNIRQRS